MKIVNLVEDTPGAEGCLYEHGLSFYIETEKHKLLFDTGATDAFLKNAVQKGIDLTAVDTVVISHGHYDHTGGLAAFRRINQTAQIYLQKGTDAPFYNLKYPMPKYIGMPEGCAAIGGSRFLEGDLAIDEELSLFSGVTGRMLWPKSNETLKVRSDDTFLQDDFAHEQYLVITEGEKRVLLSGCAHNGILNILERYSILYGGAPTHVISGFHTSQKEYSAEDDALIAETARVLGKNDTVYYTGHCTGEHAWRIFHEILEEKLFLLHSGEEIL